MPRLGLLAAIAVSTVLSCTSWVHAREMHALIVGVSGYPSLSKDLQLEGPRNDAERARDVLVQRGFAPQRIMVLADGIEGAALPTRANILTELDRLAQKAGKDDFVFLYFAGHGSQQPAGRRMAAGRAETDGLYETFLPRDVGKWSGSIGSVKNALVKTELRDAVDRILAKGAFVWGVFDSCHSATLVRDGKAGVRYRYVDPKELGVPQAALNAARRNAPRPGELAATDGVIAATAANGSTGESVFFYAAQTREETPEMILPPSRADGKYYGLFGFTVLEALASGVPMTYRQMAQHVLARYGAMNETRVTPLFSGTALDKPILFQDSPPVQQWKIERGGELVVHAGALARLSEGAIVAVMADPLAASQAAVGYLKLTHVALAASTAVPVAYNGKPALEPEAIPAGSFARAVHIPARYALRVSVDANGCDKRCAPKEAIEALRRAKEGIAGAVVTWADAPAAGDVMLKLLPDRILLLPPSLQGADCAKPAGACKQAATLLLHPGQRATAADLRDRLAESLHAVARATNLLRLAAGLPMDAGRSRLEVALTIVGKNGKKTPYSKGQVPVLHPGDRVAVSVHNNGMSAVDVTLLYVDARYGIGVLFPYEAGASNRLEPKAGHDFEIAVNDRTTGLERMLAIAVEAGRTQERADFSFLAQSPLDVRRDAAGHAAGDPDVMAFMDAGYAAYATRGDDAAPRAPSSRISMQVFTLNVAP